MVSVICIYAQAGAPAHRCECKADLLCGALRLDGTVTVSPNLVQVFFEKRKDAVNAEVSSFHHPDRQTDGQTDRQIDRQTRQTGRQTDRQTDTQTDRQTDRHPERQTDRQRDRQDRQTCSEPKCQTATFPPLSCHLVGSLGAQHRDRR